MALAACGLVAHADGIVEAGEWDRVLWMLDERIGAEDASAWVELLADRARPPTSGANLLDRSRGATAPQTPAAPSSGQ